MIRFVTGETDARTQPYTRHTAGLGLSSQGFWSDCLSWDSAVLSMSVSQGSKLRFYRWLIPKEEDPRRRSGTHTSPDITYHRLHATQTTNKSNTHPLHTDAYSTFFTHVHTNIYNLPPTHTLYSSCGHTHTQVHTNTQYPHICNKHGVVVLSPTSHTHTTYTIYVPHTTPSQIPCPIHMLIPPPCRSV